MEHYVLGLDIGSSSVKASLVNLSTGKSIIRAHAPADEMRIDAAHSGWAEQDPEAWWKYTREAVQRCVTESGIAPDKILAIGIAYQMHGLVLVDKDLKPLRPSIIWCDSRAVSIGDKAFNTLGEHYCLNNLLNSPGNFTASKLQWVQQNEPALYAKIYKAMLPGDYIALKLTGEPTTTATGLSEGIFWDHATNQISQELLAHYSIDQTLLAEVVPVFSVQGNLTKHAAAELGLTSGTPISYRSGDQPNNAFSLNVLDPGETASTAGTSGVIYSVTDQNRVDKQSRVNTFLHVNDTVEAKRNGVLMCINGTGSANSWVKRFLNSKLSYDQINDAAAGVAIGSEGLLMHPFGNGAERIFQNRELHASLSGLDFNHHQHAHVYRAVQEGVAFAFRYGFDCLAEMGITVNVIRAAHTNMFLSRVFREAYVNTIGVKLELYNSDGADGAARGAGVGAGLFSLADAHKGLERMGVEEPDKTKQSTYLEIYSNWNEHLKSKMI